MLTIDTLVEEKGSDKLMLVRTGSCMEKAAFEKGKENGYSVASITLQRKKLPAIKLEIKLKDFLNEEWSYNWSKAVFIPLDDNVAIVGSVDVSQFRWSRLDFYLVQGRGIGEKQTDKLVPVLQPYDYLQNFPGLLQSPGRLFSILGFRDDMFSARLKIKAAPFVPETETIAQVANELQARYILLMGRPTSLPIFEAEILNDSVAMQSPFIRRPIVGRLPISHPTHIGRYFDNLHDYALAPKTVGVLVPEKSLFKKKDTSLYKENGHVFSLLTKRGRAVSYHTEKELVKALQAFSIFEINSHGNISGISIGDYYCLDHYRFPELPKHPVVLYNSCYGVPKIPSSFLKMGAAACAAKYWCSYSHNKKYFAEDFSTFGELIDRINMDTLGNGFGFLIFGDPSVPLL